MSLLAIVCWESDKRHLDYIISSSYISRGDKLNDKRRRGCMGSPACWSRVQEKANKTSRGSKQGHHPGRTTGAKPRVSNLEGVGGALSPEDPPGKWKTVQAAVKPKPTCLQPTCKPCSLQPSGFQKKKGGKKKSPIEPATGEKKT